VSRSRAPLVLALIVIASTALPHAGRAQMSGTLSTAEPQCAPLSSCGPRAVADAVISFPADKALAAPQFRVGTDAGHASAALGQGCTDDWSCPGTPDGTCDAYYGCSSPKYACEANARTGVKECVFVGYCPKCEPAPGLCGGGGGGVP